MSALQCKSAFQGCPERGVPLYIGGRRFSSRDARHERHLYALRSDGAAIDVTPLASSARTRRALEHSQFARHGMVIFPCDVTASRIT